MLRRLPFAALALFGAGIATGLVAAEFYDSPQRVEQHRAPLSGAPGMEVIVSTAEYRPGEIVARHHHHGVEAVYIVQGATVRAPGQPPRALATGASLLNPRDVPHAGFTVEGPEPLKLFTVHIVDQGKPLYEYDH